MILRLKTDNKREISIIIQYSNPSRTEYIFAFHNGEFRDFRHHNLEDGLIEIRKYILDKNSIVATEVKVVAPDFGITQTIVDSILVT